MPTYEYECRICKKNFDIFQKMTDKPLKKCPSCGKPSMRRKLGTGAGIIFKGSGFYCTDYRPSSYKEAQKKDSESKPSAETSKPAEKKNDTAKASSAADSK